jgi:O-antigen/teichoic acid export membrane protein
MLTNAGSLVATAAVNLPLGFVFWWLAAHRFPASAVGVAAAAVSAMLLLSAVSVLGLGTLLVGELPRHPGRAPSLVAPALWIVGGAGLALGVAFAWIAPTISTELRPLSENAWASALFAVGVALTAMTLLLDQAVIGTLRSHLQLWRNAILAGSKLVLLLPFSARSDSPLAIYGAWTAGTLISFVCLGLFFVWQGSRPSHWRPDWRLMRSMKGAAWWHHEVNLALQVPTYTLPVIATIVVSSTKGAYFYASWMIAGLVFVIPASLAMVLYAINAVRPGQLAMLVKHSAAQSLLAAGVGVVVLWVAGPWVLHLFGPGYESHGTVPLRILAFAAIPLVVRYQYIAVSRITGTLRSSGLLVGISSVLELAAASIGATLGGLVGMSAAWTGVVCLEAIAMAPAVRGVRVMEESVRAEALRAATQDGSPSH